MDNIANLMHGFSVALTTHHILLMMAGVLLGVLVGVLPGLGAPNGVSLLLPLTFSMDPVSAIILLTSLYWGALFGGSTTSILFNIPGEPSSVATTFDGHPMAKQGKATRGAVLRLPLGRLRRAGRRHPDHAAVRLGREIRAALLLARIFRRLFHDLRELHRARRRLALQDGRLDGASASRWRRSAWTRSPATSALTFEFDVLLAGVSFLIAVIGLFGIGELLLTMEEGLRFEGVARQGPHPRRAAHARPSCRATGSRCCAPSLIGIWMGITPGGPTAASFMSYAMAKRSSRNPAKFGKGEPEGVIAPETADHAAGSAAMLPMLALGIPGSATAAVMMGGLMIWGLNPGPTLFTDRPDFVWGLIASMYLGNVVAVVVVLATVPLFASILRIPFSIIGPIIVVICFIGAYHRREQGVRHLARADLRPRRLSLQEARLSDRAAGARHGHRRQGRGRLPPVDDLQPGLALDLLVERRWSRP